MITTSDNKGQNNKFSFLFYSHISVFIRKSFRACLSSLTKFVKYGQQFAYSAEAARLLFHFAFFIWRLNLLYSFENEYPEPNRLKNC